MGNFVVRARMSEELYHAAYTFLGHRRGGLAMSTVVASAGFGSICGSSIADRATFAKVAYPSMRKFGYKDSLAAAPSPRRHARHPDPASVIIVIYGVMTETSIRPVFVAGICPASSRRCSSVSRSRGSPGAIPRRPAGRAARGPNGSRRSSSLAGGDAVRARDRRYFGGVFTATEGAA